jgi:hypothetical protein
MDLDDPQSKSIDPDVQVHIPASRSVMPPLSELIVDRRVLSLHPHGRRRALGELLCPVAPIRVSSLSVPTGGRRRLGAINRDLIGQSPLPRTPSALPAADQRTPPISQVDFVSRVPMA